MAKSSTEHYSKELDESTASCVCPPGNNGGSGVAWQGCVCDIVHNVEGNETIEVFIYIVLS